MADPAPFSGHGTPHVMFHHGGQRFVFCPIRKNASTAVMAMIAAMEAPQSGQVGLATKRFAGRSMANRVSDTLPADQMIVILRDPVDRFIAAFCDKIIAQRGAVGVFADIAAKIGPDLGQLTVAAFVDQYLAPAPLRVDPHFVPQQAHLFDRPYSAMIPMAEVYFWAAGQFGQTLANRHFLQRINARETNTYDLPTGPAPNIAALQAAFQRSNAFPNPADLIPPPLQDQLRDIYAADVALYGSLV